MNNSAVLECEVCAPLSAPEPGDSVVRSPYLGDVAWGPRSELYFPGGLPGFEDDRRMIPVEIPAQRPLVYLQSLDHPGVCFLCLPALAIDPAFELHLSEEEKAAILFDADRDPAIGTDVLCLGLLVPSGSSVESNLAAPIVISLHTSRGVQCVGAGQLRRALRLDDEGHWAGPCL